jgi:mercuric ion binding protein
MHIMKITQSLATLALSALLLVSCKETGSAPKTEVNGKTIAAAEKQAINPEKLETASFNIDGMTCAIGCAKTIENELSETSGVQKASVDFDKKTATVEFDASQQSPENLVKIVEATADGKTYKVSNLKSSKDHAMLLDQEKEKGPKKGKEKDTKKSCSTEGKKSEKASCCSGKKHCSKDEKKA